MVRRALRRGRHVLLHTPSPRLYSTIPDRSRMGKILGVAVERAPAVVAGINRPAHTVRPRRCDSSRNGGRLLALRALINLASDPCRHTSPQTLPQTHFCQRAKTPHVLALMHFLLTLLPAHYCQPTTSNTLPCLAHTHTHVRAYTTCKNHGSYFARECGERERERERERANCAMSYARMNV